ncbi:hypothetical protein CGMCC3_g10057 [Colletotrichum fructicola]|nr:uncharacterized protein CGMCC3_g10057 [Colletotrichum fructicola]KAE9573837.1 hypothetical protein CGMCC3_g10057 [Colletotrichum fructicola]
MIGIRDLLRYAATGTPEGLSALLVSRVTATCAGLAQFLLVVRPTNLRKLGKLQASSWQTTPDAGANSPAQPSPVPVPVIIVPDHVHIKPAVIGAENAWEGLAADDIRCR